jgi:hypothetical protein
MYLNGQTLLLGCYTGVFRRPFSLRRIFFISLFVVMFLMNWTVIAIGRGLDHLFFPAFKRQKIQAPVFIVATPRSGTTFLHRLMSLDQRFACFKLREMVLPAVVYYRGFEALRRLDRRIGGHLARVMEHVDRLCFGGWEDRHVTGFGHTEEDEALLAHTLVAEAVYQLFPYFDELPPIGFLDRMPERQRAKVMRFYRQSIQRLLFSTGPDKTFLSKSPGALGRIRSIIETFPDARIIHLVRHPAAVLPSHVNMFYPTWEYLTPGIGKHSPEVRNYALLAVAWYRHMMQNWRFIDQRYYIRVRYDDLVRDPYHAVTAIYDHFQMPMTPEFRARLAAATRQAREYRSRHRYSLEEFGLSQAWVQEQLGDVIEAFELRR